MRHSTDAINIKTNTSKTMAKIGTFIMFHTHAVGIMPKSKSINRGKMTTNSKKKKKKMKVPRHIMYRQPVNTTKRLCFHVCSRNHSNPSICI